MSDQNKSTNTSDAAADKIKAEAERKKKFEERQEATVKRIASGILKLEKPIRSGDADVTELYYDFNEITGWEYAEAMDSDKAAPNVFVMTSKQALALFAKAADKGTKGIDEIDIKERLGGIDAMEAVQLATLFFQTIRADQKQAYYQRVAEAAIISHTPIPDFMDMTIERFADFCKAISGAARALRPTRRARR